MVKKARKGTIICKCGARYAAVWRGNRDLPEGSKILSCKECVNE